MIPIIFLVFKIIVVLFFVGFGFTYLIIPPVLKKHGFWFAPWLGTVLIAVLAVMFNLAKVPIVKSHYAIMMLAWTLLAVAIVRKKISFRLRREDLLLAILILVSLLFNLYPLVAKAGFATTMSQSNLDPVTYSMVGDFLVDHTVFEGRDFVHYKPYLWAVGDLVHAGFRWGSPLILSFFAQVLELKSYEFFSLLITIYFVLSIPLVYLLAEMLKPKSKITVLLIIAATYIFNSTILYMLYNVFFAQFVFVGIFMVVVRLFCAYISEEKKPSNFNRFDFLIAVCLSSLTTIYSEGLVFILLPWLLFSLLDGYFKKRWLFLQVLLKISLLTFLINPFSLGTAARQIMTVLSSTSKVAFIGWEKIPYAAPLEILGFYNLYYSRDLSVMFDIILGLPLVGVVLFALTRVQNKMFFIANFITFGSIYILYRFVFSNYYIYHKAITYTVFLQVVFFSFGVDFFFSLLKSKVVKMIIIVLFFVFSLRSSYRTIYQLYWHPYIVDASLISLQALNNNQKINQPFFTADVYLGEYHLWKRLWREYMLFDKAIVTRQNYPSEKNNLKDIKWVLAEKNYLEREEKKLIYKNIVWENEYYQLGEIESVSIASDLLKY